MSETLPLFEDLASGPERSAASAAPPARHPPTADGPGAPEAERHLRAAWRLSRSMWRYRDGSPEQTRAGLAICQHLQALLTDHPAP